MNAAYGDDTDSGQSGKFYLFILYMYPKWDHKFANRVYIAIISCKKSKYKLLSLKSDCVTTHVVLYH